MLDTDWNPEAPRYKAEMQIGKWKMKAHVLDQNLILMSISSNQIFLSVRYKSFSEMKVLNQELSRIK